MSDTDIEYTRVAFNSGLVWSYEAPTAHLKFIDGKLHQKWQIGDINENREEWRIVPSEDAEANK